MTDDQIKFLNQLAVAKGIISVACGQCNINRSTYYRWRQNTEFAERADEIMEMQGDFVERKLLNLIEANDTQAIIFYCKTKLKHRGYTDKPALAQQNQPQPIQPALPITNEEKAKLQRRVDGKKAYIVKLLKEQGKYTVELSMQVKILAQLLVKTDDLAAQVLAEQHSAINVEISREGNERQTVSAVERLYLDYVKRCQEALKATGMNKDSREKLIADDGLQAFMDEFKDDE